TGGIYSSNPSISSVTAATTLSAVATITFTAISGGGGSGVASRDVSAALVIDKSGSMWTDKLVSAEIAGKMFVDQMATGPNNNCAVVLFDDHVSVEASMRNAAANKQSLIDAVTTEAAYGGSTALYYAIANGIWEASKEAASATRVRAVVALTDGGENASPYPYSGTSTGTIELVNQAVAAGIPVYTVGLYMSSSEASYYAPYLKSIALGTTGSESNYFEVIVGVTGLSAQRARALGVLTDLYTQLFTGLSQSYSMTSQISSSLTAGQTYWLLITFTAPVQGGSTITQTLVIPFIAH
ncbi:MAG TPA: vWA domain-containing protein, partial [Candidatus Omnitrophota bacterium]|nr:vWA domain-containing protein [Candidatus Omnitrophota bacterium]